MTSYHSPVLLKESIDGLNIQPDGIYVDATFGGGGHTMKILERLMGGRLISFDQDEDAAKEAEKIKHRSFTFCQANFRYLRQYLKLNGINRVNGILADLGVSSHQFDTAERGFSTRLEGPLDMRMHKESKLTAAKVVNEYPEDRLHKIFGMYGELKNARTAAKMVVQARLLHPLKSTLDLKKALTAVTPKGKENKYFAQVFQALRIEVNEEMQALEDFLHQSGEVMEKGGRLVVISYHSLEDRMVKNYINAGKIHGEVEKDFYGNKIKPFEAVNRKPIEASEEEIESNNRARSARMRVAERI